MKKTLFSVVISVLCLITAYSQTVNVNLSGSVINLKHNFQCGNDGLLGQDPHPRWQFRFGYWNGSSLTQSDLTNNADYGTTTYGPPGRLACGDYTKTITLPSFSGVAADYVRIDMKSWEEDESLTVCCDQIQTQGNSGGNPCVLPCANADDNCFGWKDISGQISYWNNPPCATYSYYGDYSSGSFLSSHGRGGASSCGGVFSDYDNTNAGDYGINQLKLSWDFASKPSITLQPDATSLGGAARNVCTGLPFTLQFSTNSFNGWTLGRWVKWQSAPDVSGSPGTWSDIGGTLNGSANTTTTTFSYTPTLVSGTTTWYRAVASSECGPGPGFGASLTQTTNAVKVTVYNGTSDVFCTAPSCNTKYVDPVYGNDANTGGPTDPYNTISKALSTTPSYIRIAQGSGTEPNICNLIDNVIIEGGYLRSGTGTPATYERWEKSASAVTSITFSGQENNPELTSPAANSSIRHIAAFKSNGKSGWVVKDLNINTSATPSSTYANNGCGMSNYGFLILNASSNYTISRVSIAVGNAGNGQAGAANVTAGGGGAGGNTGGAGGSSANGCGNPAGGNAGNAGSAGTGGPSYTYVAGEDGSAGGGGTAGGDPGGSGSACCSGLNGNGGGVGTAGKKGKSWNPADRPTASIANTVYYMPSGQAESGGSGGGGGKGGGGSGARFGTCVCFSDNGGNGGTGGNGGDGGAGGVGGWGAGGAFGVWRNNSGTGAVLTEVNISSLGSGGTGGSGASGRPGVSGTGGASGGCDGSSCGQCAGNGNTGGAGGAGGTGRNGANGNSAQMVTDGALSPSPSAVTTPNNIKIDYFSTRNNVTGRACRYSEIDLSTSYSMPGWTLPSGLSIVYDKKPAAYNGGSSTYSGLDQALMKVTTDNSSLFYDLTVNSNTFKNGLYVVPDARTLPSITDAIVEICAGGSATLGVTNSYDVGNIQQREWLVYDSLLSSSTPLAPFASSSSTAPSFSGFPVPSGDYKAYIVRYRERHNCCGWSRPVFSLLRVFKDPTDPAIIPSPAETILCVGSGASATFSKGTGGAACTFAYEYMLNGDNNWLTYSPGSVVGTTATSSISVRVRKNCPGTGSNITHDCGNEIIDSYTWSVAADPTLSAIRDTSVCPGSTVTVSSVVTGGSGRFGYIWQRYDGLTFNSVQANDVPGITYSPDPASTNTLTISGDGTESAQVILYRLFVIDSATGCNSVSTSFNVTILRPVGNADISKLYTCDGTAQLTASSISSGTSISWELKSGPGSPSPSTSTDNPLTVSNLSTGTTVYRLLGSSSACSDVKLDSVSIVMPSLLNTQIASVSPYSCAYCIMTDGNTRTYYNSNGEIIATITDDGSVSPSALGETEVCTRTDASVQTITDDMGYQQPYLPRQWTISPASNTSSFITLYFKISELTALQNAANSTRYQFSGLGDLLVTKYPGGQSGTFTPPCTGGTPGCGHITGVNVPVTISSDPLTGQYKAQFTVSSFSTFYIHPALFPFSVLPVELMSFTGWNENSVNKLQWVTASENNSLKYEIQKSLSAANWNTIGEVAAFGNSSQLRNYTFTDNDPVVGNNYYRLKMLDKDGKFTYTGIINVPIVDAVVNGFVSVFPNPTTGELNVVIQSTGIYDVTVTAYDVVGKKVYEKMTNLSMGLNILKFDLTSIAKGTYVLRFSDNAGVVHTTKFIKE